MVSWACKSKEEAFLLLSAPPVQGYFVCTLYKVDVLASNIITLGWDLLRHSLEELSGFQQIIALTSLKSLPYGQSCQALNR
jgi:hypothetical protein